MGNRHDSLRTLMFVVTVLLLLGGGLGILVVAPSASGGREGSDDAGVGAGGALAAAPEGATSTVAVEAEPLPSTADAAAPAAPAGGVVDGPKTGDYRYRDVRTGSDGKVSESERATPVSRAPDEGGIVVVRVSEPLSTGSGEVTSVTTQRRGPDGAVATETTVRLYGGSFLCDWQPDYTLYGAKLAPGASWSSDTSCEAKVQGGQLDGAAITMGRRDRHKVIETKDVEVLGRTVSTLTITRVTEVELTSDGLSGVTRTEGTEQFGPAIGMPTSSDDTVTLDSFGQKRTYRSVRTLVAAP